MGVKMNGMCPVRCNLIVKLTRPVGLVCGS